MGCVVPSYIEVNSKCNSPSGLKERYQKEVDNMVCWNKRVSLEANTLKRQLNSAEGEAAYVQLENESLKRQLKYLEKGTW